MVARKKTVKRAVKETGKAKTRIKVVKKSTKGSKSKKTSQSTTKTKKMTKIKEPLNKSELFRRLSEGTTLPRKTIVQIFEELGDIISSHLTKGGAEKFVLPGILKMTIKKVKARKATRGINPFTGEEMMFKAKPASRRVKISALKRLKEMLE